MRTVRRFRGIRHCRPIPTIMLGETIPTLAVTSQQNGVIELTTSRPTFSLNVSAPEPITYVKIRDETFNTVIGEGNISAAFPTSDNSADVVAGLALSQWVALNATVGPAEDTFLSLRWPEIVQEMKVTQKSSAPHSIRLHPELPMRKRWL